VRRLPTRSLRPEVRWEIGKGSSVARLKVEEMTKDSVMAEVKVAHDVVAATGMVDEGGVNKRGVEAATVAGNRDMDKLKAIQGDDEDEKENADRRLMVHGNLVGEVLEDEEEEFVFEEGAPEEGLLMGWFAVARYYSGHNLPVKVIFSDLF
jgi:hypothetical protein